MSGLGSRLARVEKMAQQTQPAGKVHFVTVEGDADEDAPIQAMIASGEAQASDLFIVTHYEAQP